MRDVPVIETDVYDRLVHVHRPADDNRAVVPTQPNIADVSWVEERGWKRGRDQTYGDDPPFSNPPKYSTPMNIVERMGMNEKLSYLRKSTVEIVTSSSSRRDITEL